MGPALSLRERVWGEGLSGPAAGRGPYRLAVPFIPMATMRSLVSPFLAGVCLFMATAQSDAGERQITHDSAYDHLLDNNDNFSPDDRFLVFDTRTPVGIHESALIAKVEIATGKITPLYRPQQANAFGPGVAAASFAHQHNEVIFIHGPLHPTGLENQYEKHCRLGMIVRGDGSGEWRFADDAEFEAAVHRQAFRGGTHRHEFSGDEPMGRLRRITTTSSEPTVSPSARTSTCGRSA